MRNSIPVAALPADVWLLEGKRTIGLNPALVELLIPLVASRPGKELGLQH